MAAKPSPGTAALSEREIWRCATLMVEGYGEGALYRAAFVAHDMERRGLTERRAAWKRILRAIGEFERTSSSHGTMH